MSEMLPERVAHTRGCMASRWASEWAVSGLSLLTRASATPSLWRKQGWVRPVQKPVLVLVFADPQISPKTCLFHAWQVHKPLPCPDAHGPAVGGALAQHMAPRSTPQVARPTKKAVWVNCSPSCIRSVSSPPLLSVLLHLPHAWEADVYKLGKWAPDMASSWVYPLEAQEGRGIPCWASIGLHPSSKSQDFREAPQDPSALSRQLQAQGTCSLLWLACCPTTRAVLLTLPTWTRPHQPLPAGHGGAICLLPGPWWILPAFLVYQSLPKAW